MRETLCPLRVGYDGLLEAVFALAAKDEWKAQKARLRTATGDGEIEKKHEKLIRKQIGLMLVSELNEFPATHTRTKELREQTFNRIMERIG